MKHFLHSRTLLGTARGAIPPKSAENVKAGEAMLKMKRGWAEFAGLHRQLCGVGNTERFVQRRERLGAVVLQHPQVTSSDVCGELFRGNLNDADGRKCFGMR